MNAAMYVRAAAFRTLFTPAASCPGCMIPISRKIILQQMGIVQPGAEVAGVNNVLNAAALTYVAAFIAALGNLLWLLSVRDRRS